MDLKRQRRIGGRHFGGKKMYKKVLFATDGSEQSLKAARKLVDAAQIWQGATITIFHAENHHLPPASIPLPFAFQMTNPNYEYRIPDKDYMLIRENFRKFGEKILQETKKIFDDAKVPVSTELVIDESPASYAKRAVKEQKFDLVVVGARGHHSKLREVFLGSVCEEIMNQVDCDVLLVR